MIFTPAQLKMIIQNDSVFHRAGTWPWGCSSRSFSWRWACHDGDFLTRIGHQIARHTMHA